MAHKGWVKMVMLEICSFIIHCLSFIKVLWTINHAGGDFEVMLKDHESTIFNYHLLIVFIINQLNLSDQF